MGDYINDYIAWTDPATGIQHADVPTHDNIARYSEREVDANRIGKTTVHSESDKASAEATAGYFGFANGAGQSFGFGFHV